MKRGQKSQGASRLRCREAAAFDSPQLPFLHAEARGPTQDGSEDGAAAALQVSPLDPSTLPPVGPRPQTPQAPSQVYGSDELGTHLLPTPKKPLLSEMKLRHDYILRA